MWPHLFCSFIVPRWDWNVYFGITKKCGFVTDNLWRQTPTVIRTPVMENCSLKAKFTNEKSSKSVTNDEFEEDVHWGGEMQISDWKRNQEKLVFLWRIDVNWLRSNDFRNADWKSSSLFLTKNYLMQVIVTTLLQRFLILLQVVGDPFTYLDQWIVTWIGFFLNLGQNVSVIIELQFDGHCSKQCIFMMHDWQKVQRVSWFSLQ